MLWGEHLLLDTQGLLVERFGLSVLSPILQIEGRLMEKTSGLWYIERILIHELCTS